MTKMPTKVLLLTQMLCLLVVAKRTFADRGSLRDAGISIDPQQPCPHEPKCLCQKQMVVTKEKTTVTCKNASLTKVPTQLPNNTVYLDLSFNKIRQLDAGKFKRYPSLLHLNISFNNITQISDTKTFEGLRKLSYLTLQNNTIRYNSTGLAPGIFKPLSALETLNIQQHFTRHDYLGDSYELEALYDLPNLRSLHLDGIPYQNLGKVFQVGLRSLKELIFSRKWGNSRCYLPKLTQGFFRPNMSVSYVTLKNCEIRTIYAKTFQSLTFLEYLELSNNEHLRFDSMNNLTDGLKSTAIKIIKLNKVHKTFGPCVELSKEFLKSLAGLNLIELHLESNRISTLDGKGVKYIPTTLETVSVKDNILLFDNYILDLLNRHTFANLRKLNLADQSRNHYAFFHLIKREIVQQNRAALSSDNNQMINGGAQNKSKHFTKRHLLVNETAKSLDENRMNESEFQNEGELDTFINRKFAGWMSGVPIPLPTNFTSLDVSNMKIRLTLSAFTLETPNNLRELSINRNIYWAWIGPLKGFGNLTKLDLSWNSCNYMKHSLFKEMPNLKVLNLSLNYLDTSLNSDKNGVIFYNQAKLEVLSISENRLRSLPRNIFSGLKNLTYLHLARNLLKTFEVDLSHMTHLMKVNLHDNQLETISANVRADFDHHHDYVENFTVNLERNNFKCDCTNQDFLKWISESPVKFENIQNYFCYFKDGTVGNLTDAGNIYRALKKECFNYTAIIVSGTAAIVLVLSLSAAALVYRYRWHFRYMYYMAKYKAKQPTPAVRGYEAIRTGENQFKDVNVSYADEDASFIRHKIHEQIEVARGLKLHIRDRDAPVADISDNIFDAIETTKKTLIVLSKDYLKHKWCICEMHMAGITAMKSDTNMLCVLMMEEVPTKDLPRKVIKIIKDNEHLEYPGEENLQDLFWDRLYDLLNRAS